MRGHVLIIARGQTVKLVALILPIQSRAIPSYKKSHSPKLKMKSEFQVKTAAQISRVSFATLVSDDSREYAETSNHYVTQRCEGVLKPALELAQNASDHLHEFIQAEAGHDSILKRAIGSMGKIQKIFRYYNPRNS